MRKKLSAHLPIVMLSAGHGSVDFYVNIFQALAPGMALHLGLPLGKVIILVGVGQLVCNLIQPLVGWVMGKRNLSWVLWIATILAVLPALMGWATGFWSLALLIVLGAVGTGLFHPEGILAAHDASGEYAYLGVPLFMAGGYFLSAAAAPISINWVGYFGYHALAWLALPGLALGIALLVRYRKKRREHPSVVKRPRSRRVTKREEGRMSFWPLLGVSVCFGVATGLFFAILTSHYDLTFGPEARAWAGWVILAMGGIGSLSSFFWGHVTRKGGYYLVVLLTQLAAFPLFIWLAHAPSPVAGFLIALPLSFISPGAVYPISVSLARNASGVTQALRTALMVGGTWGVSALIVMFAGILMDWGVGSSQLVMISAAATLCAALLAGVQVLKERLTGTGRASR